MVRVVAGKYRGRRLETPSGKHTRPTSDKVREGIFNVLAGRMDWAHARVLDLFAGSGALGIEALSRGANQALFVEAHGRTAAGIRKNLQLLEIPPGQAKVIAAPVEKWLAVSLEKQPLNNQPLNAADEPKDFKGQFKPDLILMDPPYAFEEYDKVLYLLSQSGIMAEGAYMVVETSKNMELDVPDALDQIQVKRYGDTQVWFFRMGGSHRD